MNSFFAEYAADSRNPRRIALGGGDRGIKTVFGRIVERLRFASRRNNRFGGNFCADFHSQVCKSEAYSVSLDRSVSVSPSFELINPPAINISAVFLRYFPAFEEGGGVPEQYSVCAGDSGNGFRVEKQPGSGWLDHSICGASRLRRRNDRSFLEGVQYGC